MDCSPPGSSLHGIHQVRILERVAMRFSRGSSQPRNQTGVPCIAGRFFTSWATREAPDQATLFAYCNHLKKKKLAAFQSSFMYHYIPIMLYLSLFISAWGCWRRPLRGFNHNHLLTLEIGGSLPLPLPWNIHSAQGFHLGSHFQVRSPERAVCC